MDDLSTLVYRNCRTMAQDGISGNDCLQRTGLTLSYSTETDGITLKTRDMQKT